MTLTEVGQGSQILGHIYFNGPGPLGDAASPFLLSIPSLWRHGTLLYFTPELGDQRLFVT